jgi:hypothetical protein
VNEDGTSQRLATIADDPNTDISGARDDVTISAGGNYYLWNGTAISLPGGGFLDYIGSVEFIDQFTLLSELDGRIVEWTTPGDPADRNPLYFATAESQDDKIIRLLTTGPYFAVMKEHSVETWGNTGLGGINAFQRVGGEVAPRGVRDFNLIAHTPNGPFYVGEDNLAYLGAAPVSTPTVTDALNEGQPTHCFYFEWRGHQFATIRFEDRPAWIHDIAMGDWHERSNGPQHKPWDVIASVYCYDRWHLADRHGRIYTLGEQPVDAGAPLRRTIVSRTLFQDDEPFTVNKLQLLGLFGNYSIPETAPGWITDANGFPITDHLDQYILENQQHPTEQTKRASRMWIRVSDDGGRTWSEPFVEDIGRVGDMKAKAEFWAMGQFESLTIEINMTDPMDVPLMSEGVVELT